MAAGDFTLDTGSPRQVSNYWELTGTLEVDDTLRAFALASTKSRLLSFQLNDADGTGSAQARINEDASGTATNGTVAVLGDAASTETYRFVAHFV